MRSKPIVFVSLLIGIAACSHEGSPAFLPASSVARVSSQSSSSAYKILYSFNTGTDGQAPQARLTVYLGHLYGTTLSGGSYGVGTIFKLSTAGAESVVHSFDYADGSRPTGGLRPFNGALYGTAPLGGAHGEGAIFAFLSNGRLRVLHSFRAGADGAHPLADLTALNGVIYGTTYSGGTSKGEYDGEFCGIVSSPIGPSWSDPPTCGTIFKINANGQESRIYTFSSGNPSWAVPGNPLSDFTPLNGAFYGTTFNGGSNGFCFGTVYALNARGVVTVIHDFGGTDTCSPDGGGPIGDLVAYHGVLYGTTYYGGTSTRCAGGGASQCGTVFSITSSRKESVLHSFGAPDGYWPTAGLTLLHGRLYGVTSAGGTADRGTCGILFSITTSGQEQILHDFGSVSGDGCTPLGGLTALHGTLYGTTSAGGAHGQGTVFAFTP